MEISALAPPAEAHARVAYALAEVRKYLIPDSNDVIRQEQLRELIADGAIPGESDVEPIASKHYKSRAGAHIPRSTYPTSRYESFKGISLVVPNETERFYSHIFCCRVQTVSIPAGSTRTVNASQAENTINSGSCPIGNGRFVSGV